MATRLSFSCPAETDNTEHPQYITLLQRLNCHHVLDSITNTAAPDYVTVKLAATKRTSLWDMLRTWKPPTLNSRTRTANYNYGVVCERIPGWGLVARTDGASAQQLNADTLQQGKEFVFGDLSPQLRGTLMAPSHGVYDEKAKEYVNVAWDFPPFGGDATYRVFRVDGMGQTEILASFKKQPTFMHCVAVTERYVVVLLPPVRVSVPMFLASLSLGDSLRDAHGEDQDDAAVANNGGRTRKKIGGTAVVVCRKGTRGVVAQIELDAKTPLTAMHIANAWDAEDEDENADADKSDSIVIETIALVSSLSEMVNADTNAMAQPVPVDACPGPLVRLTLRGIPSSSSSLSSTNHKSKRIVTNNNNKKGLRPFTSNTSNSMERGASIEWNTVNSFSGELPTINPLYRFKRHRYTYSVMQVNGLINSCVRKTDAESRNKGMSFAMSGCVFDEPLFVADPNGSEEDDGVLLLVGLDTIRKRSFVCVVDAKDLTVSAVAEIEEEKYRVPMAFHWYRDVIPQ